MSALSEAEKRRILKERRQKKFTGGGGSDRLSKITGQADSLMSTESALDVKAQKEKSNSTSKKDDVPNESSNSADGNPQVSLFKHLAEENRQNDSGSPPDFMSMLQSLTGDKSNDSTAPGVGSSSTPVDQTLVDYHNYLVNNLKAYCIVIKWICLVPYMYVVTHDLNLNLPMGGLLDSYNFFSVLIGFEIVATSIYYNRLRSIEKETNIDSMTNDSKIAKLISLIPDQSPGVKSIKSHLFTLLQYWDVVSMLITDICFVLVVLGIFTHT